MEKKWERETTCGSQMMAMPLVTHWASITTTIEPFQILEARVKRWSSENLVSWSIMIVGFS
jgi:hypothetical protein